MAKVDTSDPAAEIARHAEFLRRVARSLVHAGEADDLAHDALLAGWQKAKPEGARVEGWLARVCRNALRQRRRAEARRRAREEAGARGERLPPASAVAEHRAAARAIVEALLALDERSYAILQLRYFEGLPPRAIAARTGLPVATVKRRLERALARVRARLDGGNARVRSGLLLVAGRPWAAGPVAAEAGVLPAFVGGALMTKKLAFAALALAVACGFGWFLVTDPPRVTVDEPGGSGAGAVADPARGTPPADVRPLETAAFATAGELAVARERVLAAADRDLDVFGWVVDGVGAPVAGASVRTLRYPWQRVSVLNAEGHLEAEEVERAATDAHGAFVLRHRRGAIVHLRVGAAGFATQDVPECQAGEKVVVVLERAASLTVRAVTEDGTPVPGARVRFWRKDQRLPGAAYDHRRGETGEGGLCAWHDLAPGAGIVEIVHPAFQVDWTRVAAGTEGPIDVVLRAGRTIAGRVTDRESGRPIPGARVADSWTFSRTATTGEDGRYTLPGYGASEIQLHAVAGGYGRMTRRVSDDGTADFALARGDTVTGRVIGVDAAPVPGALVTAVASAWGPGSLQETDSVSGSSGDDGSFALEGIRHDLAHTLVVQARGHGRILLDFAPPAEAPGTIDLGAVRLPEARAIEGRARTAGGLPLTGAAVTLTGCNADRTRLTGKATTALGMFDYGREETRRTDDLGRFRFPDLAPGRYEVAVKREGSAPLEASVVLEPDRDVRDLELVLPSGRELTVRVVDDAGAPVGGIDVEIGIGASTTATRLRSDAEGRARFDGLPPDAIVTVHVEPWSKPYLDAPTLQVEPGVSEVTYALVRAAVISGRVVGPDGAALPGMQVEARGAGETDRFAVADQDGRFEILCRHGALLELAVPGVRHPRPGPAIERTRHRAHLERIKAPAANLVLRTRLVEADRSLRVLVVAPDGTPAAGVAVLAPHAGVRTVTGEDGMADLAGLFAETTPVRALAPKDALLADSTTAAVLPEGQTITLGLRPATALTGTAFDAAGRPAAGAHVTVTDPEGSTSRATTDSEGRFRVQVAADVPHELTVWRKDPVTGALRRAVVGGVIAGEVTLRLE